MLYLKKKKSREEVNDLNGFVDPGYLCIYLSLVRSGAMDCGSLICSFVDSSSERDAT